MKFEMRTNTFPLEHSADWRFLLPISANSACLLLGRGLGDVAQLFAQLGFPTHLADFEELRRETPLLLTNFDFALLPLGFVGNTLNKEVETLAEIAKMLRPGGRILLGFSNRYNIYPARSAATSPAAPARIRKALTAAGYAEAVFYAALPNLELAEYIFPLNRQAAAFVLDRRYQHKTPFGPQGWKALLGIAPLLLDLFPAYFATAVLR
ncbi:MAG: hypothetical protein LC108_14545 [Anaerolineales bacterium]|nr:hypothetical protein [Anaerolineales bacterium]OQY88195.1 MAG: hypothetical protein B6D38_10310 [Anaerolineae bacterium UTCFX1]